MAVRTASHTVAAEARRLGALDSYRILGSEAEKDLDDIVKLAAQVWNTPIASITFVDVDRQFFKAKVGLDINETARPRGDIRSCAPSSRVRRFRGRGQTRGESRAPRARRREQREASPWGTPA